MDIDFRHIASRCGGQREAFEELCCQLAARTLLGLRLVRLRGAGGDGGVECFADHPGTGRRGWQAKYVFDIDSLITQADKSLSTALAVHPTLTEYVVCFPFDVTGPTKRRGKAGHEKLEEWRVAREKRAQNRGRNLKIHAWPASRIRELLIEHDKSGGMRAFFFNQTILTEEWFAERLAIAKKTAGPRYTPELNVRTDLWWWFAAFGRTADWARDFQEKVRACRKAYERLSSAISSGSADPAVPAWPSTLREKALGVADRAQKALGDLNQLIETDDTQKHDAYRKRLDNLLGELRELEVKILDDLEHQHGRGRPDSPGYRQYMAEYMVSFPMANLDRVRELIAPVGELSTWLASPAGALAARRAFVLAGAAGSGKTHGVCDAGDRRLQEGLLTCVTFGHEFRGEPDPWTRLLESLGLPVQLGMNGLLDALNAAGAASGFPLLLCVDAVNETRPLPYWRDRIGAVVEAASRRPYVRLCLSCRSSFLQLCLPDGHDLFVAEHTGFEGVEREACQAFFRHYDLLPPIAPILQPEFSNPLYLKLVCQTLHARGLRQLPTGWHGLAPTIRAFLDFKEQQFAVEFSAIAGARIVSGSLIAIARTMAESSLAALSWSQAAAAISAAKPATNASQVLDWLIRADLLIEDAPSTPDLIVEHEVRPAFERLGDFLVASELLERARRDGLQVAARPGGLLHALAKDDNAAARNAGVLSALAVLVPETDTGIELPDLFIGQTVHSLLLRSTVRAFQFRDPGTFTHASREVVRRSLALGDFLGETLDALIAIAWQPSAIDATWLDDVLRWKPLAERDAFWCSYLHDRFQSRGLVHRLIDAAFELSLDQLNEDIADRWSTTLFWFTAAADRRVKDRATRALTKILSSTSSVIPDVLRRLISCDDDEVRERLLLVCYSALILSRDSYALRQTLEVLKGAIRSEESTFDNALIRDDVRCIAELARELNVAPKDEELAWATQTMGGQWPLEFPSAEDAERWGELIFKPSEFSSDFFKYSMNCLEPWMDEITKKQMAEWILQRVARDFGYEGSGCEDYDRTMLARYGGGRARAAWAERIGKKYQWVAMYQLASRLSDNVDRKRDSWVPATLRTPLILLEERKIDPTIWRKNATEKGHQAWWITGRADLDRGDRLSDEDWVDKDDDVPSLEEIVSVVKRNRSTWRVLLSYPAWSRRDEEGDLHQRYRRVWLHVRSYLVAKKHLETAYACLDGRNFFGGWMPEGASWLYGFAGEYPWGSAFNTEPDRWYSRGGSESDLPVCLAPTSNELTIEFEYDATKAPNYFVCLPGRNFFALGDLWWNGADGFCRRDGKTVFRDPSMIDSGPPTLLADAEDLQERLSVSGKCLIWTMLGEKGVIGGMTEERTPMRTFSQIASLDEKGVLRTGERRFFRDYNEDASPQLIDSKPRAKSSAKRRSGRPTKKER